jgi:hypothetical protein
MDEEVFNMSIRKFLKKVGITSQQEIERVIREAVANGDIDENSVCKVSAELKLELSDRSLVIDGEIRLS